MADESSPGQNRSNTRRNLLFTERVDLIIRILLMTAIAVGCWFVIRPFLTAILISAVVAVVTWPLFASIRSRVGKTTTPASAIMVLGLIVCVLIPLSFILIAVAQQMPAAVELVVSFLKNPEPILLAIKDIPYAGSWLYSQLVVLIDPSTFSHTIEKIIEPASQVVLSSALSAGNILFQLALVTFIVFFFYKDGFWIQEKIGMLLRKVSGGISTEIASILTNTTRSVVFGIAGTAVGQGVVAYVGFIIADVPGAILLASTVCILSIVPIGPPLVWGPAAVWLYFSGETGWAVFLILWGTLAVSSVDNFLKPILISRGTSLPISIVFLGVFGGVIAFGFLGLILGPLLLALGLALLQAWLKNPIAKSLRIVRNESFAAGTEILEDEHEKHHHASLKRKKKKNLLDDSLSQ